MVPKITQKRGISYLKRLLTYVFDERQVQGICNLELGIGFKNAH